MFQKILQRLQIGSSLITKEYSEPTKIGTERGPHCRPNESGFILDAAAAVPSAKIASEIKAGANFFKRHGLDFAESEPPLRKTMTAIHELTQKPPKLDINNSVPDVSIIIPVYGQLHFVLNCLDSLASQNSRFSAELLVVDDSTPLHLGTQNLRSIPWIHYIYREKNLGFIGSCNEAAKISKGRHIVLLNSDTRVVEGWLDELLHSFIEFPKAGLVGSKLYNEDGTLQEAGGVFWRDGNAWNYGRGGDGDDPKYCFARRADYCSGASIAFTRVAWEAMHGFDEHFLPAYCEDADIAFRLRQANYEVWFQPLSMALHYEGRTHGKDLKSGIKSYQVLNMKKFFDRWQSTLQHHSIDFDHPEIEVNRFARKRILVIDSETPTPNRDCGSVIVVRLLITLRSLGYQVTFVPQDNYLFDGSYTADLQRMGVECIYAPYLNNIGEILDIQSDFDVVLVFRYNMLNPVWRLLRTRMPLARIIFSNVDLHYLREQREAAITGSQRALNAALLTKAAELELMCRTDCNIVHTEFEAQVIESETELDNVIVLPYTAEVIPSSVAFQDRHDIMFLGGFRHLPNVDAMLYFHANVWPKLLSKLPPQTRLLIVGSSPPADIRGLQSDRVVVTGFVDELKPWFDAARVFIAPLRYGAGIKGKVMEGLRHGTPCVLTSIAAEGIGLVTGLDAFIADKDEDFADKVIQLFEDQVLWSGMQKAAHDLILRHFDPHQLQSICVKALATADASWVARHERSLKGRLTLARGE